MFYVVICFILCNAVLAKSLNQETLGFSNAVENFQNAVQQQTFESVLVAIEERLKNLDNIYSMQLSETIKTKLDQYHRKLESLDIKIIRLESMAMLNLDKLTENISTKTYKDDIAVTQTDRKLDNIYDGLSHRINYMDRKSDMALDKLQNKIDTILLRIETMEENMMQRNSDIEAELSETLFVIEDLKTSTGNNEHSLLNINNILNHTLTTVPIIESINLTMQTLLKNFSKSIVQLEKIDENSLRSLNVLKESNSFLDSMKKELKNDFNDYANKVADMNVDIWKRNDLADGSLKTIETVANSTIVEVQNGIRALMLQTAKLSGKGILNNDGLSLETVKKSVDLSLEKIITNQELFLESCHRVQMDESQIETEISDMLGKLIDMLEKKMTTVMKDLKSLEKSVKNHDSKIVRHLYQANDNIQALTDKTTKTSEFSKKELQEIKLYVNSLFSFVQDVLPKSMGTNAPSQNTQELLNELLVNITSLIQNLSGNTDQKWTKLENMVVNHNNITKNIDEQIKKFLQIMSGSDFNSHRALPNKINTTDSSRGSKTNNCSQDFKELTDIKIDVRTCIDDTKQQSSDNKSESSLKAKRNGTIAYDDFFKTLSLSSKPQDVDLFKKSLWDIFSTVPSPTISSTTKNVLVNASAVTRTKKKCSENWIDVFGFKNKNKACRGNKKRIRKKMKTRLNEDDETFEYDDSTEELYDYTDDPSTTENLSENTMTSTQMPITDGIEVTNDPLETITV